MNTAIEDLNSQMRTIAAKNSMTHDDLKFLEECLLSKWNGVQVMAAKVLAKLHPPEALTLLKEWLMRSVNNFQVLHIAHSALLWCITDDDLPWVFDLYLKSRGRHARFLLGALLQFPNDTVMQDLIQDCKQPNNYDSVMILWQVLRKKRQAVLKELLSHPDVGNKDMLRQYFGKRSDSYQPSQAHIDFYKLFSRPL